MQEKFTPSIPDLLFREAIGERIAETGGGYDHNFILSKKPPVPIAGYTLPRVATVAGDRLTMSVFTDQSSMQFYTANFLSGDRPVMKGGAVKHKHAAFCMETQGYPNACNVPSFPSNVLRKGDVFRSKTIYKFEVE